MVRCGIQIRGVFSRRSAAALGAFDVEESGGTSTLRSSLPSEDQLRQVLGRLDDLGIEVVSVTLDRRQSVAGAD